MVVENHHETVSVIKSFCSFLLSVCEYGRNTLHF